MELELNKIYCMDCMLGIDKISDKSIDLIITDPPFIIHSGLGGGFMKNNKKKHLQKVKEAFGSDFNPTEFLNKLPRIMKKFNGYFWCSNLQVPIYLNWAIERGFAFQILTWHKSNPVPLFNNTFLPDTEYCVVIREKGAYFNSELKDYRKYKKFWITNVGIEANGHPTPKPIQIMRDHLQVSSRPGSLVLDPFMGSGTTAVACKQLDRQFIGFELHQKFIDIATRRLSQEKLVQERLII